MSRHVQTWINAVGAKTTYIIPGSPWENGATGEVEEDFVPESEKSPAAVELGRAGGRVRAKAIDPTRRKEIAVLMG